MPWRKVNILCEFTWKNFISIPFVFIEKLSKFWWMFFAGKLCLLKINCFNANTALGLTLLTFTEKLFFMKNSHKIMMQIGIICSALYFINNKNQNEHHHASRFVWHHKELEAFKTHLIKKQEIWREIFLQNFHFLCLLSRNHIGLVEKHRFQISSACIYNLQNWAFVCCKGRLSFNKINLLVILSDTLTQKNLTRTSYHVTVIPISNKMKSTIQNCIFYSNERTWHDIIRNDSLSWRNLIKNREDKNNLKLIFLNFV